MAIEDGMWSEWRGPKDDQQPRKLSQGELAKLLAPFRIKPRTVWPIGPRIGSSKKGYRREWFEAAWSAYCPEAGTTAQPNKTRHLERPERHIGGTQLAQGVGNVPA